MLTPKQAIFIAEFEVDGNATRAAIAAGYSEKTAEAAGSRLLRNVKVAAVIAERRARRVERLDITVERTARELAKLSYFDPGRLFDEHGKLKPVVELDEVTRAAVESVEVDPESGKIKKIVMAKKGQNLERLGRYQGMFTDNVHHSGTLTLEQLVCGGAGIGGDKGPEPDQ
jgi:phage terminase small subunit